MGEVRRSFARGRVSVYLVRLLIVCCGFPFYLDIRKETGLGGNLKIQNFWIYGGLLEDF